MCVLIPAHNEEVLIPRCLHSVRRAARHLEDRATVDIVVVADHCQDQTARVASTLLRGLGTTVEVVVGRAGGARLLAARSALQRTRMPLARCWFANTDADCIVPPSWLSDQLALAHQGIEAFAGTISVDSFVEHGPEVPARFRASYRVEADGSHPHVHGANIGVRADAYLDAGGWSNIPTAEDHDLWRRLKRLNKRVLSTSRIEVITSGRRHGRAPNGFADALAAHNEVAA